MRVSRHGGDSTLTVPVCQWPAKYCHVSATCCPQTSHAITLQKTMEYITKLQQERMQMQEEARRLREEIEELNTTIM